MRLRIAPLLRHLAAVAALTLLLRAAPAAADFSTEWKPARATHYSAPGDVWTIHDGSCTHQYIWPDIGTGARAWRAGWVDRVDDESALHARAALLPRRPNSHRQPGAGPLAAAPAAPPPSSIHAGWDAGALSDQNADFIGSCG